MTTGTRMLADIGGTNARFAWQQGPGAPLQHVQVLQCQEHAGLAEAAERWLADHHLPSPERAALAVACAVQSDVVKLTNNPWTFSIRALQRHFGLLQLEVVNDFTALALALPSMDAQYLRQIGGAQTQMPFVQRAPVALLGAGTGLGVSGLLPDPHGGWVPLAGEGGHVSLPIHDDVQYRIWSALQSRDGHVSAETVLSGQGLVNLYDCLLRQSTGHWPAQSLTPAQITAQALVQQDPLATQVIEIFCNWLGAVAGDLALTLGATGGVFIGGGIAPRLGGALQSSGFRSSFEGKGAYAAYLQPVPVWVIDAPVSPALQGVASLLD